MRLYGWGIGLVENHVHVLRLSFGVSTNYENRFQDNGSGACGDPGTRDVCGCSYTLVSIVDSVF